MKFVCIHQRLLDYRLANSLNTWYRHKENIPKPIDCSKTCKQNTMK
jgi:hypothetical protein